MATIKNICTETLERHCLKEPNGRLDLRLGEHEGQIFTYGHFIVHAQLAGLEGVPALFRLLDWGDAETTWHSDVVTDKTSLNLPMGAACVLYAEHLQERAELEAREKERFRELDQTLTAPELIAGLTGGIESILKNYTIFLECTPEEYLPGGFIFSDTTKASYVLGSSEECDVVLLHPSIDPRHCGIILENGSIYIWDLGGQAGIKLNDVPVAEGVLKVGDVMTLGALEIRVRFSLRRPTLRATASSMTPGAKAPQPLPTSVTQTMGMPSIAKFRGPITYTKISDHLKNRKKSEPFLNKLGTLFGAKKSK
jgi:hypothetical protein